MRSEVPISCQLIEAREAADLNMLLQHAARLDQRVEKSIPQHAGSHMDWVRVTGSEGAVEPLFLGRPGFARALAMGHYPLLLIRDGKTDLISPTHKSRKSQRARSVRA